MTRIFVSSTYSDLITYRDVVQKVIRQSGAQAIGMEDFGARDERPLDECLRLIREEADVFIGIYAHRYGYVPDGMSKSISECEYREAIARDIPVFAYVIDDDYPWTISFVDKGEAAEHLATFKMNLSKKHIVKKFGEPFELAANVAADLARQSLRTGLVDARASRPREASAVQQSIEERSFKSADVRLPPNTDEWNNKRFLIYNSNRNVFLDYDVETSSNVSQWFDITIRLVRKSNSKASLARDDLSDVERAEFFFGPSWGNLVYSVHNTDGRLGVILSAYGEFLAYCRVYFKDGYAADIYQFIRFPDEHSESAPS